MKRPHFGLFVSLSLTLGLIVVFALLTASTSRPSLAQGGSGTVRVARNHPGAQDNTGCGSEGTPCKTIQHAVNEAQAGDQVLVAAGRYDDGVNSYGGRDQAVYISKTLDLRGGYTYTNWALSDPGQYTTTIDANDAGRVILITGPVTVTIEGFEIVEGNATALRGCAVDEGDCGGGLYASQANVVLLSARIHGNQASQDDDGAGGGVYVWATPANTLLVSDCEFYDNAAVSTGLGLQGAGGGLSVEGGSATVPASRFVSNTASLGMGCEGGGIHAIETTLSLSGTHLLGNTASTSDWGAGGGVYLEQGSVTIYDSQLLDNTAGTDGQCFGGGLYLGYPATATLVANTISGNVAGQVESHAGRGGGVYAGRDVSATLSANLITGNVASTAGDSMGAGGGLCATDSARLVLMGNTISGNKAATAASAEGSGGGIHSNDVVKLLFEGNTVEGNTASVGLEGTGGGVYLNHQGGEALFKANEVLENTAGVSQDGRGGGIYLYDVAVTFQANKFVGNIAASNAVSTGIGGGIYVSGRVRMTMTNNLIAANSGPTGSDGMLFTGSGTSRSRGNLVHNTFADNGHLPGTGTSAAAGEGIIIGGGSRLVMTDTIISGHSGTGLEVGANARAELEATLWHSNGIHISGTGTISTGTIFLEGDPAYVDVASRDYHLSPASAAIDEGIENNVYDDLDGVTRPALAGFDIGAYEFPLGVTLAADLSQVGQPGALVTYSHTLANIGVVTDAYSVAHSSDQGWMVTYANPVTLGAGVSETLVISIQVPGDAVSGTVDATVVTVTSRSEPSLKAAVMDTTTVRARVHRVYLPVVLKNH